MRRARRIGASSSMTRMRSPLMRLLLRSRDGKGDDGSFAGQAFDPDPAAMCLDQPLADRETDAGASRRFGRLTAHELFKDAIPITARHARTIVRHVEDRFTIVHAQSAPDN